MVILFVCFLAGHKYSFIFFIFKHVLIETIPTTINIYCSSNVTTFPGFPYLHVRTWPPQKYTQMLYWGLCGFMSKKSWYYRLILFNMSSWMCILPCVAVQVFSLFLSRYSVPRAQCCPHEDLRQAGTWEWESNAVYIGISPHKRKRDSAKEKSYSTDDEPSTHFLSFARGGALPRDSSQHRDYSRAPAAKKRYVKPRTNINISYKDIQIGRVESQSMLIWARWVYRLNIRVICMH